MRPMTDSAVPDQNAPIYLSADSTLFHGPRTFIHARIQRSEYLVVQTTLSRMEKHKAVNFPRKTGLEPLEEHKATDVGSSSDR